VVQESVRLFVPARRNGPALRGVDPAHTPPAAEAQHGLAPLDVKRAFSPTPDAAVHIIARTGPVAKFSRRLRN